MSDHRSLLEAGADPHGLFPYETNRPIDFIRLRDRLFKRNVIVAGRRSVRIIVNPIGFVIDVVWKNTVVGGEA
jgi:hypothetical protein